MQPAQAHLCTDVFSSKCFQGCLRCLKRCKENKWADVYVAHYEYWWERGRFKNIYLIISANRRCGLFIFPNWIFIKVS